MIPVASHQWQAGRSAVPLAVAAMVGLAILGQALLIPVDADVSWLITVCERLLAGGRLYVDIIEANPPASVWLYLPEVWLAHRLGLRPEPLVVGFAIAGALLSLGATLVLARRLTRSPCASSLALGAGFALLVLPGGLMAQREHFALMLALPVTAALARLADRRPPGRAGLVCAGIAAGLMVVIKPPFALPILLPALWAAARARDVRPFLLPLAAAASVVALYLLSILFLTPGYLQLLPMLQVTYLPMRDRPLNFLLGPMLTIPAGLYLLGRMLRVRRAPPLATAMFLASAGFALAGLVQGKNYLNHSYPGIALALAGFAILWPERSPASRARPALIAAALMLVGLALRGTLLVQPPPGLAEAIARAGPASPTVITLGSELATGHPATRLAGGRWAGSRPALFTAAGARYAGLGDKNVRRWYREDLDSFVHDVRTARPDLVLVEDGSRPWLLADPAIRQAMAAYVPAGRAAGIEVWRRR